MMNRIVPMLVLALSLTFASVASATPADDVTALLKVVGDGMNKADSKAAVAAFADDADLVNPGGLVGKGKANVEKILAGDIATILKGTTSKFTVETVRDLGNNVWLVDATHEIQNATGPDGKKMTLKLHLVAVTTLSKDKKLQISAARPYGFMPAPAPAAATPATTAKPVAKPATK